MNWLQTLAAKTLKALSLTQYVEQVILGMGNSLRVEDAYSKVDVVFAAIMAKWTALDSIPWALYDAKNNVVEEGPAADLMRSPHPQITRTQFLAWVTISLDLRGKAFFWIEATEKGTPVTLWPLLPQNMTPVFAVHPETGTKLVSSWRYSSPSGKQVSFDPQELLIFRYPHPTDWWDGLARLRPADLAVSQYHSATDFQARSFGNDGMIAGLLTAKSPLSPDQIEAARASWQATYAGSRNAKKTAVLGSDWEYRRLALTPQELDFLESNKWGLQRICMALGVPPAILGIQGNSQLGAGKESDSHSSNFWLNTVIPLMGLVETSFESQLFGNPLWVWPRKDGRVRQSAIGFLAKRLAQIRAAAPRANLVMAFDRDQVTALSDQRNRLLTSVKALWDMGVPLADASEYYGLGIPERPWHQTGFLPFSVTPADMVGAEPSSTASTALVAPKHQSADGSTAPTDPFQRIASALGKLKTSDRRTHEWRRHDATLSKFGKRLRLAFKAHFARQRIELLRRLEAQKSKAIGKGLFAEIVFDLSAENSRLVATVRPLLQGMMQQAGAQQYEELGDAGHYRLGERAEAWLEKFAANAQKVNETNVSALRDIIERETAEGQIPDLDALAERIREFYRERENNGARVDGDTAALGVYNGARTDAQEQLGIEEQEWLSARDERVRPSHQEADGQRVPIGAAFQVGDAKLLFPGDPAGPLEEVINCRCVAVPVTD